NAQQWTHAQMYCILFIIRYVRIAVFILYCATRQAKKEEKKMTQDTTAQILTPDKTQAESRPNLQPGQAEAGKTVESYQIRWPEWPTSKPGPHTTPPPAGTKPINAIRSE